MNTETGPQEERIPVSGVVLAAGESRRMGQLKALLPWGPTDDPTAPPILVAQVRALREAGIGCPRVVLGHEAEQLRAALEAHGCLTYTEVIVNDNYRLGRSTSVIAGVAACPAGRDLLLINVGPAATGRADPPAIGGPAVSGGAHYRAALRGAAGTSADLRRSAP